MKELYQGPKYSYINVRVIQIIFTRYSKVTQQLNMEKKNKTSKTMVYLKRRQQSLNLSFSGTVHLYTWL